MGATHCCAYAAYTCKDGRIVRNVQQIRAQPLLPDMGPRQTLTLTRPSKAGSAEMAGGAKGSSLEVSGGYPAARASVLAGGVPAGMLTNAEAVASTLGSMAAVSAWVDDGEDDWVDELPRGCRASTATLARRRCGISAACLKTNGRASDMEKRKTVVKKTKEQEDQLHVWLRAGSLKPFLAEATEEDVQEAVDACRLIWVGQGQQIIRQGEEEGTDLFVLEEGRLEAFRRRNASEDGMGSWVATFDKPGQHFGELALLHGSARAATVVATQQSKLWCLDRDTFKSVMRDNAIRRREQITEFLQSVKLLQRLDLVAISQLVDATSVEVYKRGQHVLKAGELGSCFYIVEAGEAVARINGQDARSYARGSYFGELALIKDRPRAADVVVRSVELKVLRVDRVSFQRLLGQNVLFEDHAGSGGGHVRNSTGAGAITNSTNTKANTSGKGVRFNGNTAEKATSVSPARRATGFVSKEKLVELMREVEAGGAGQPGQPGGVRFLVQSDRLKVLLDEAESGNSKAKTSKPHRSTGFVQADSLRKLLEQAGEVEDNQEWDPVDHEQPPARGARGTGYVDSKLIQKLVSEADGEDTDGEVTGQVRKGLKIPCLCGRVPTQH